MAKSNVKPISRAASSSTVERLSVVETKVESLDEKVDEIKLDIKDMHDCLDRTRDELKQQLILMQVQSTEQHEALAVEVGKLKTEKDKIVWTVAGGLIVISWITAHMDTIKNLF